MKRIMITLLASGAALGAVPTAALAHHHHHHRMRSRLERFGRAAAAQPNFTSNSAPSGTAGTVVSFSGGVLTIMLNDHSTVSGTVANKTELECTSSSSSSSASDAGQTREDGGQRGSDGSSDGNDGSASAGDGDTSAPAPTTSNSEDDSRTGEDQGDDQQEACSTSSLIPGAVVQEAELSITSTGAVWKKLELA